MMTDAERSAAVDDFLAHYGVKGMRWGVRKEDAPAAPKVLKKGTTIYNISADKPRDIKGAVYGAHEKRDVVNYRGQYATSLTTFRGAKSAFSNDFVVKKDIKVATERDQIEAFKELWNKDRDGVARALAESQKDMKIGAAIMARGFKKDRTEVYFQRISKKGERWVNKKGAIELTRALGAETDKPRDLVFKALQKRGFDALVDLNDVKNYGSKDPILVFKGSTTLKRKGVPVELTAKDIEAANNAYLYRKLLDKYNIEELHQPTRR